MARIKDIRAKRVERPLLTTFGTALGERRTVESVIVTVLLDDGTEGAGEVPSAIAFRNETVRTTLEVVEGARPVLAGARIGEWTELASDLRQRFRPERMAVSGLEVALFRAALAERGATEHQYWGARLGKIETDITLPLVSDRRAIERWAAYACRKGFRAFKLKVSGRPGKDREILSYIYGLLEEKAQLFRLRLDGNQGFTAGTFLAFAGFIEKAGYGIELFEQPLPKDDFDGLASIRGRTAMPIVLDESVVTAEDARRAVEYGLGDGINIKLAKSGMGESAQILEIARKGGMKLMIGCMMETMVGLSAAVFFAAGTGAFDYIDLDSVHFLYGRNAYPGIEREGPAFLV